MKKVIVLLFLTLSIAYAEKPARMITDSERQEVYAIGKANGVPLSVVRQLMQEESGGYCDAVSHRTEAGFYSRGLFQLYDKPGNLEWLLAKFWTGGPFDIYDPIDNATVSMRYLAWIHNRFGNWYQACIYYNHGNVKGYSEQTRAYALRIINAR
jgi:soluble lytic murein transglycosylase-like protein